MPDRDNTYSTNQIKKISQCHSSLGKRTRLASPKLDRWKDLNKAIIDWQNNDALDETSIKVAEDNNFQFYDTIQKRFYLTYLKDLEQFIQKEILTLIMNI